jgi:putative hydrolase of the HAD superfamily
MLTKIAFDADDTLWDEAHLYEHAEHKFLSQVSNSAGRPEMRKQLRTFHATRILEFGYGPRGYKRALAAFSEVSFDRTTCRLAKSLANTVCDEIESAPIQPLPGVVTSLERLSGSFELILITKGEENLQRSKLERSGLGNAFGRVIVVEEKDQELYEREFGRPGRTPHAAMIGNSLKSDIAPAIAAGAYGLHVPSERQCALEVFEGEISGQLMMTFRTVAEATDWLLRHR